MTVWYFLEKGRPRGPVNSDFIVAEIRAGRLHRQDLIYGERDTQWREVQFFAEFQRHLEQQTKKASDATLRKKDDRWVLLVRKHEGGGYRQKGPFTTAEIIAQLKAGKITVTDYIWREGLKEWYKILAVPEIKEQLFDPELQTKTAVPVPVPVPKSIDDIVDQNTKTQTKADPIPETTITKTAPKAELKADPPIKKVRPGRAANAKVHVEGRRMSALTYFMDLAPVQRTIFGSILFVTIVGLVFAIFWASAYLDRRNAVLKRPTVAEVPPTPVNHWPVHPPKPRPTVVRARPKVVAIKAQPHIVSHPPTYLRVQKENDGTTSPLLHVITDASAQFSVKVKLGAEGGYVLNHRSFFAERIFRNLKDRAVDLEDWHLPWGIYHYHVVCQNQSADGTVRVGTFEKDWPKKIRQQRKNEIFEHNYERVGYIRTADHLASVTAKIANAARLRLTPSSWRTFYLGWREEFTRIENPIMNRISDRNREDYLHPTQWMALRKLRAAIEHTSWKLNHAEIRKKNTLALARNLRQQSRQANALKEQMIQTSIMR